MKKKLIIIIPIVLLVIIGVSLYFLLNKKEEPIENNINFISLGLLDRNILENGQTKVYTSYEEYHNDLNNDKLKESDFKSYNYILLKIPYDSCSESEITPTDYSLENNKLNVTVKYKADCGVCAPEYIYFLLKTDKNTTSISGIDFDYQAVNNPHCDSNVDRKPLIYIYPEKETEVTVKLGYPERLTTTYPKYNNEWKVTAYPNGDLKDGKNTYYGLYWEGIDNIEVTFEDGFVVKGEDTISFLEEKLSILGLNDRERNEFIIYWLPKLENNKYNLIRFETIDNINKNMPLEITPKPDTLIRVLMEYKVLDKEINIKEQQLTTPTRTGYTVVEWGGTQKK